VKKLLGIWLAMLPLWAMAQVSVSGTHYEIPSPVNVDHVILFADLSQNDCYLSYTGGSTAFEWRDFSGAVIQSGTGAEALYPENDRGYTLYTPDTTVTFYVLDYNSYRVTLNALTAVAGCESTELTLDGIIPEMSYQDQYLMTHRLTRQAEVHYTTLSWGGVEAGWVDSAAVETVRLQPVMTVDAPFKDTEFTLLVDQFAVALGMDRDSILSDEMTAQNIDPIIEKAREILTK